MKGLLPKIIIFIGILSLITGNMVSFASSKSHAKDLEIVGKELGLEVTPTSTKLFDLSSLNPGDTREACITIANRYCAPFELFMRTERMGAIPEGDADLFKQLRLRVYLGDEEIYSGSMMDYATSNISLGKFQPEDIEKLKATVHLPGPDTGNEFQGKSVDVKWIFIAQAEDCQPTQPEPKPEPEDPKAPILPKTGEMSSMGFYSLGVLLLGLGIGIGRKKKE
ncbi:MAG TPA: LPXTG cell wall anchor domain-containing protein [Clostridia bacterium]|nr:LPXTG cell wall anchor domain-containing protein [Clostridia bacterium]